LLPQCNDAADQDVTLQKKMKHLRVVAFLALLVLNACKKEPASSEALLGKWHLQDQRVSIGTPVVTWEPATPGQTVEFKRNGDFEGSVGMFANFKRYEITRDSTLLLSGGTGSSMTVRYRLDQPYLQLNPLCFEECSYRFTK
jgi:hypothetical protein